MTNSAETVTVHVPFTIKKRGGRREIFLPAASPETQSTVDNTLLKAIGRAYRWKRLIDEGTFTTIAELAKHENIAASYMTRVLRLSLLAPDIVEAILDGNAPHLKLKDLLNPFPLDWQAQRKLMKLD